jgi:hypothetical protein
MAINCPSIANCRPIAAQRENRLTQLVEAKRLVVVGERLVNEMPQRQDSSWLKAALFVGCFVLTGFGVTPSLVANWIWCDPVNGWQLPRAALNPVEVHIQRVAFPRDIESTDCEAVQQQSPGSRSAPRDHTENHHINPEGVAHSLAHSDRPDSPSPLPTYRYKFASPASNLEPDPILTEPPAQSRRQVAMAEVVVSRQSAINTK